MTHAQRLYLLPADLTLLVHFAFVAFVIAGLLLIWLRRLCRSRFVSNLWFRVSHLAAIGIVAGQAVLGIICPLKIWENRLRLLAGGEGRHQGSFINIGCIVGCSSTRRKAPSPMPTLRSFWQSL